MHEDEEWEIDIDDLAEEMSEWIKREHEDMMRNEMQDTFTGE